MRNGMQKTAGGGGETVEGPMGGAGSDYNGKAAGGDEEAEWV